jgi:hypothetical protein
MTSSILTKLALAAAATMITLSPALADWRGKPQHSYGYQQHYGKGSYYNYKKRKHAREYSHNHRHYGHRHWKPRFHAWKYGYRPYRGW